MLTVEVSFFSFE